jgi:hypothetical protein
VLQGLRLFPEVSPSGVCVVLVDCITASSRGVRCLCITGNGLAVAGVCGVDTVVVHLDTRMAYFLWGRGGSEVVVGW